MKRFIIMALKISKKLGFCTNFVNNKIKSPKIFSVSVAIDRFNFETMGKRISRSMMIRLTNAILNSENATLSGTTTYSKVIF
jgi:hypothetical protein